MANKKQVQEVNASSMADISFLLLIFFLVSTTMNVDSGISRVLPPMPDTEQVDEVPVKERNLMLVFVSKSGNIMVGTEMVGIRQLKDKAKDFLRNRYDSEDLPEKKMTEIAGLGQFAVSEGIISLQNDRATSYDIYIQVQNELTRAVNELRDELSLERFGKTFNDLSDETQKKAIGEAIPQRISEAEPRDNTNS